MVNNDPNRLLLDLNSAKSAGIVYDRFSEFIELRRKKLIDKLKSAHRQGQIGEVQYASLVAALVELDDLENEVQQTIKRGEKAAKELYNGSPPKSG